VPATLYAAPYVVVAPEEKVIVVAGAPTVTFVVAVSPLWFESPLYVAVRVCDPTPSELKFDDV
jgi:hypothetical protein